MSLRNRLYVFSLLFILSKNLLAQHQEVQEKPGIWRGKPSEEVDSTSLLYAFKTGTAEGHIRYFFSATDNTHGLKDFYGNAFGGGLRYETGKFHGFQMAISGFYIFNVFSSDFTKTDSITKQGSRYEVTLFDIEDPTNKKDLDRLEEFYLKYNFGKSFIRAGRQLINTPFINLQDGRMRPTGVEGLWFEFNEIKKLHVEGGWIYAISPRSTVKWFSTANSVGVFPSGVSTDGKKSDYAGNIISEGVFMLGAKIKATDWLNVSLWDLYFENVQNSALVQTDFNFKHDESSSYIAGLQFIRQDAINDGGNPDSSKRYIDKGTAAMTAGARAGYKTEKWEATLNYNRIFNTGRYVMPREWGRDPFFTFMPRERNEGYGDVHGIVGKVSYNMPEIRLRNALSVGYFKLPDVKNFVLNKYGMPSYIQANADIRYSFKGLLQGMDLQLLIVAKLNQGNTYDDMRYVINKVDMVLYNLVMNYRF